MACDRNSALISKLACRFSGALSPKAGRAAYVAGAAAVGIGAAALMTSQRQRLRAILARRQTNAPAVQPKPPPAAAAPLVTLTRRPLARSSQPNKGERCAQCGSGGVNGSWYRLNNRMFCPSCAPQAARQAGVDLAPDAAPTASTSASTIKLSTAGVGLLPTSAIGRTPGYLPPEQRVPLNFTPSRIRVRVGQQPDGQPAWHTVGQGFVALHQNGQDTGLAVTPAVRIGPLQSNGTQEVMEDTHEWLIIHLPSGKPLGNQAFSNPETAQALTTILAQLDWTRAENQITDQEISRVNRTFRFYSQALKQEQQRRPEAVHKPFAVGSLLLYPPQQMPPGSMTGLLVADNVGGVGRVVTDHGDHLFVADSYGQRYEIKRDEVRPPTEADFTLSRLAMPVDPAGHKNSFCSNCGAAAATASGSGQSWYRMDLTAFCPSCAISYAHDNGYEMPETVGE